MKKFLHITHIASILILLITGIIPAKAAIPFAASSPLAKGNWAKIGVTESGIYEITYSQLRDLGFNNPEKVGIWGEGGIMYPLDFQDRNGNRKIPDGLVKVAVLHKHDKILFYAQGPENLEWISDTNVKGGIRCNSKGLNIYSNYGIYFLSDTENPKEAQINTLTPSQNNEIIKSGLAYVYHEKDINQGNAYSSQEFWGEDFMDSHSFTQTFPYIAPGLLPEGDASLAVRFMAMSGSYQTVNYGVDDESSSPIVSRTGYVSSASTYYRTNSPLAGSQTVKNKTGNIKISAPDNNALTLQKRLDWWILTYTRKLDFDEDENQFFARPQITANSTIQIPEGDDVVMWDITSPESPINIIPSSDTQRIAALNNGYRNIICFHSSKSQKTPLLLKKIENQNLHSYATSHNPSMIIFTTQIMKPYADQLAKFHETHEGKDVLIITTEELYNEFSSGRPDPMAYRSFAKMMYDQPNSRLEAVLFYGPIRSNVRQQNPDGTIPDLLIAYQSEKGLNAINTNCIMDVYGMLGDNPFTTTSESIINSFGTSILMPTQMQISVGVIPATSTTEAQRVNNKIINYILDPNKPYWCDRMIYICDDYDDALHITQSERMAKTFINDTQNHATLVKAYAGEYGKENIISKIIEAYEEGAIANNYIGHGSTSSVGMSEFLVTSHVLKMHNKRLSFMNFAGCMATMYENGVRGIPEHMFLSSDNALVGGQLSVRTSYANENEAYMTQWQKQILTNHDSKYRPLTIGQASMLTKNAITDNSGKMKFHLFGDPLMRLPIATTKINIANPPTTATINQPININGNITSTQGDNITDFNGLLVAKWIEAPYSEKIKNKISGYKGGNGTSHPQGYNDSVIYQEKILDTQAFNVKDGNFSINIAIPSIDGMHPGKTIKLSLVAYDVDNQITAWASQQITLLPNSDLTPDTQMPIIEQFSLSGANNTIVAPNFTINIIASDNHGLRIDDKSPEMPLALMLDGKKLKNISSHTTLEDGSRKININMPLTNIPLGHHSLQLHICDYSGNRSAQTLNFEVRNDTRLAAPVLTEKICTTQATLTLTNEATGTPTLYITDAYGNIIYHSICNNEIKWNLSNNQGQRVAPGIYKAYILFNDQNGKGNATHPVTIPVLAALQ